MNTDVRAIMLLLEENDATIIAKMIILYTFHEHIQFCLLALVLIKRCLKINCLIKNQKRIDS